jgi:hypothetical protein
LCNPVSFRIKELHNVLGTEGPEVSKEEKTDTRRTAELFSS